MVLGSSGVQFRMIKEKWMRLCTNHVWGNCNGYNYYEYSGIK